MKKKVFGAAALVTAAAAVVAGLRRFAPTLAERGMKKCQEMMGHMSQECLPEQTVQGQEESQEDRELGSLGEDQKARSMAVTT